jgi:radical SAM superfamily enzyme YgiQ (UPF0313 family)
VERTIPRPRRGQAFRNHKTGDAHTMRILLILPASGNWQGVARRRSFNGRVFRFSMLSLLTLAELAPDDAEVRIVDEQIESVPEDEAFDLVGITAMTALAPRAYELAGRFRARGVPVVLGGIHATLNPDEALEHADSIVVGPAYGAWPALLDDLRAGQLRRVYHGDLYAPIPRSLPRHMIERSGYVTVNATFATLGCRNACRFCSINAANRGARRLRDVPEVADEIASFRERFFVLVDDNLIQDRAYALELFEAMAPLGKKWVTQASIDAADDLELLGAMRRAGCIGVFVGLETFNPDSLREQQKEPNLTSPLSSRARDRARNRNRTSKGEWQKETDYDHDYDHEHDREEKTSAGRRCHDRYRDAVRAFHRHGMFVEAGVMFGFDKDEAGVFRETLAMLERIGIDAIQTAILTPLPGTPLFDDMKGRITDRNWEHYDYRHVVFEPARMSAEDLQAGADWVIRRFYSPWRIFKRALRWIRMPGGIRNLAAPLAVNWGYYGRTVAFGIRGYDPADARRRASLRPVPAMDTQRCPS